MPTLLSALLLLTSCELISDDDAERVYDADADGMLWVADCDDADPGIDRITYYLDADRDGFGDPKQVIRECEPPEADGSWITFGADCDDQDDAVHPGAEELCDDLDNDCDDAVDEGEDLDGDGWPACDDCDDDEPDANPGAAEICGDGLDNDCDGMALGCGIGLGEVDPTDAFTSIYGDATNQELGSVVANIGDLNSDNINDIIIGAPEAIQGSAGQVYILFGPMTPGEATLSDGATVSAGLGILNAQSEGDRLGFSTVWGPDMDDRGSRRDLLLGAPGRHDDAGSVFLIFDPPPPGEQALSDALGAEIVGAEAGAQLGYALIGAALPESDANPLFLIGAPDASPASTGRVISVTGPLTNGIYAAEDLTVTTYIGEDTTDHAGWSVANGKDVDGDGLGDIFISAPRRHEGDIADRGVVYLVLGASATSGEVSLADADLALRGEAENDRAGANVTPGGWVLDADEETILVSAPGGADSAGRVYLLRNDTLDAALVNEDWLFDLADADTIFSGGAAGDNLSSTRAVSDLDGDGHDDIMLGAPGVNNERGAAYLWYGGDDLLGHWGTDSADAWLLGESPGDHLGHLVSPTGEITSDLTHAGQTGTGFPDILIGVPGWSENLGALYLFTGGPGL